MRTDTRGAMAGPSPSTRLLLLCVAPLLLLWPSAVEPRMASRGISSAESEEEQHGPQAKRVVRVGGSVGWTMRSFDEPLRVSVGSVLNFTFDEEEDAHIGGHDVWLLPSLRAFEACDFRGGRRLGANGVLFEVASPGAYFFACSVMEGAHCTAGHKVKVVASRGRVLRSFRPAKDEMDVLREKIATAMAQHNLQLQSAAPGGGEGVRGAAANRGTASSLPWCASGTDYTTWTDYAAFDMFSCNMVSGIHVQQMYTKRIVVTDRTDTVNTILKLPTADQQNAYGEEMYFSGDTTYPLLSIPLNVSTNLFCSTGQLLPDGRMISIGGSTDAETTILLQNGSFSIRSFSSPCNASYCSFGLEEAMTSRRWYPTAQIMPDGRVLIVGGSNTTGNVAINKRSVNNPTVEYFPRRRGEGNYFVQFLDQTVPYNLYAFVHLLPSGKVFIFAGSQYILFDSSTNREVSRNYPNLNVTSDLYPGVPVYRSYPMSGTSAMFPLRPSQGYVAEIMVCGGTSKLATPVNGGSQKDSSKNVVFYADYMCYRITPETSNPAWVPEPMCDTTACNIKYRRVMGDAVLLADGNLLIVNGAQQGFQGLTTPSGAYRGGFARSPQYQPLLYFTLNHTWYPASRLPQSRVPRLYHSSAVLLHDASVLITGSNPNTVHSTKGPFPTEFRIERFRPPYVTTGLARPVITQSPKAITVNTVFAVFFTATQSSTVSVLTTRFSFTLVFQGFSTHNQRHGMRNVNLQISSVLGVRSGSYVASVRAPPSLNHAPPTMYWLYLLDNGIPNVEAKAINVTKSLRSIRRSAFRDNVIFF